MLVLSLSNMKKILLTILFTLVLTGGVSAKIIEFEKCINTKINGEQTSWGQDGWNYYTGMVNTSPYDRIEFTFKNGTIKNQLLSIDLEKKIITSMRILDDDYVKIQKKRKQAGAKGILQEKFSSYQFNITGTTSKLITGISNRKDKTSILVDLENNTYESGSASYKCKRVGSDPKPILPNYNFKVLNYLECRSPNRGVFSLIDFDLKKKTFNMNHIQRIYPLKEQYFEFKIDELKGEILNLTLIQNKSQKYTFDLRNYDFKYLGRENKKDYTKYYCLKHDQNDIDLVKNISLDEYLNDPSIYRFKERYLGNTIGSQLKYLSNKSQYTEKSILKQCGGLMLHYVDRYEKGDLTDPKSFKMYEDNLKLYLLAARKVFSKTMSPDEAKIYVNEEFTKYSDIFYRTMLVGSMTQLENYYVCMLHFRNYTKNNIL